MHFTLTFFDWQFRSNLKEKVGILDTSIKTITIHRAGKGMWNGKSFQRRIGQGELEAYAKVNFWRTFLDWENFWGPLPLKKLILLRKKYVTGTRTFSNNINYYRVQPQANCQGWLGRELIFYVEKLSQVNQIEFKSYQLLLCHIFKESCRKLKFADFSTRVFGNSLHKNFLRGN